MAPDRIDRVGGAVCRGAWPPSGGVPQRRRLDEWLAFRSERGGEPQPPGDRDRARRGGSSGWDRPRSLGPRAGRRRAGREHARQRVRLHRLPQPPRPSDRRPGFRRPVWRLPLDLRQLLLDDPPRGSGVPLHDDHGGGVGSNGPSAGQRRRPAIRFPPDRRSGPAVPGRLGRGDRGCRAARPPRGKRGRAPARGRGGTGRGGRGRGGCRGRRRPTGYPQPPAAPGRTCVAPAGGYPWAAVVPARALRPEVHLRRDGTAWGSGSR